MSGYRLRLYQEAAALAADAGRWDDLWGRSAAPPPTARARCVAHWVRTFAPARLFGLAVEHEGQLVAALPLVVGRTKRLLSVVRLPWNDWCAAGDLLLDPLTDTDEALDVLLDGVRATRRPLLWLDGVPLEHGPWRQFAAAIARRGQRAECHERYRIGTVEIGRDWAAYQARWSGNFRRQMRKMLKRGEELGGAALAMYRPTSRSEVEPLLRLGFEIEDRGWKGVAGTSVLRSAGAWDYYREQANILAEQGELMLSFLEHRGEKIAFEYGWISRGTYYSPKVGYDEAHARLSPGQLLRYRLFEQFFELEAVQQVDFAGPLAEATEKWVTSSYGIHRLVASVGTWNGNVLLRAYRAMRRKPSSASDRCEAQPVAETSTAACAAVS